ncbi:hypothetical protein DAPPUDRAFT_237863 [Daphnia pulex]|uniref:Kinesin motor domain-containing protein n=1 Tax=Daphnia pulex TaxID=6669 RepID=E9G4L4_DAPPU|nr:hypothetical protein DAPPUDRAFT_237863 [Daphnia pulex]|eukprot:EFX85316.1 hypothetical protein DAPPUDRAFT_237863 [Daphnia pulex]
MRAHRLKHDPKRFQCESTDTTCYAHFSRKDNAGFGSTHMREKHNGEATPKRNEEKRTPLADVARKRVAQEDKTKDKEMGHCLVKAAITLLSRHLTANALPSSLAAEFPAILAPADLKFCATKSVMAAFPISATEKTLMENKIRELELQNDRLERERTRLEGELFASKNEVTGLRRSMAEMSSRMSSASAGHRAELEYLQPAVTKLEGELIASQEEVTELHRSMAEMSSASAGLRAELEYLQPAVTKLEGELIASQEEVTELHRSMDEMSSAFAGLRAELEYLQRHLKSEKADNAKLRNDVFVSTEEILVLQARLRHEETERRKHHEIIQQLRGKLRVFCRVRPTLPLEKEIEDLSVLEKFGQRATQQQIFDEIKQLFQSALDGFNVCILFAYGPTGSGKTFTMEGGYGVDSKGMIPRALDFIFAKCESLRAIGWTYKIEASCLEIYNENIRDLLGPSGVVHDIQIVKNKTVVTNLKVEEVKNKEQALFTLQGSATARERIANLAH